MNCLLLLAQQSSSAGSFTLFGIGGVFLLLAFVIAFGATIFWAWMLIDCAMSSKPTVEKLVWLLLIFCTHILGAILWFVIGRGFSSRMV